jgi:hypothetical protein
MTVHQTPLLKALVRFDLAVTAWFAVPGLAGLFIRLVDVLGTTTGLAEPLPPFTAFNLFLLNLAGVLGVCWNWAILRTRAFALYQINWVARLVVAALIVYYVVLRDVTPVILVFAVSEVFGSLVEMRLEPETKQ